VIVESNAVVKSVCIWRNGNGIWFSLIGVWGTGGSKDVKWRWKGSSDWDVKQCVVCGVAVLKRWGEYGSWGHGSCVEWQKM